jgi:hypothetical protein
VSLDFAIKKTVGRDYQSAWYQSAAQHSEEQLINRLLYVHSTAASLEPSRFSVTHNINHQFNYVFFSLKKQYY